MPQAAALELVFGYGAGLDMTRRDLQGEAKKLGRPWEVGKAFEASAPCSAVRRPRSDIPPGRDLARGNSATRQRGDLSQMIWKVPEIIAYLSGLFELRPATSSSRERPRGWAPSSPATGCTAVSSMSARSS